MGAPDRIAALTRAIAWFVAELRSDGQERVAAGAGHRAAWERGTASAAIVAPVAQPLRLLALGRSPATPRGGVRGQVVVVDTFEQLDALGAAGVRGKDRALQSHDAAVHRGARLGLRRRVALSDKGPARAAALGAKAALVRSLTARIDGTPHAGLTTWGADPKAPRIPAAAIATEDAETIARLAAAGPVEVTGDAHVESGGRRGHRQRGRRAARPRAPRRDRAHWRAHRFMGRGAGRTRRRRGLRDHGRSAGHLAPCGPHAAPHDPRGSVHQRGVGIGRRRRPTSLRTPRCLLWHVAAFEADTGGYAPRGLRFSGEAEAPALVRTRDLVTLLAPLGADRVVIGYSGHDIEPFDASLTARFGLDMDGSSYLHLHQLGARHARQGRYSWNDLQADAVLMAICGVCDRRLARALECSARRGGTPKAERRGSVRSSGAGCETLWAM